MDAVTLFASLAIAAGFAAMACTALQMVFDRAGAEPDRAMPEPSPRFAPRVTARLLIGLACLAAFGAFLGTWMEAMATADEGAVQVGPAWGALWVYVVAMLTEWRLLGLNAAAQRALGGAILATVGVLLLGLFLDLWTVLAPPAMLVCEEGELVLDVADPIVVGVAALGLSLVPLSGAAFSRLHAGRGGRAIPLSTAAATVVVAIWLQPLLGRLGWLPFEVAAGAPLAFLLAGGLVPLGLAMPRGHTVTAIAAVAYLGLGVIGCLLLAKL